jgi:hypothetical protein
VSHAQEIEWLRKQVAVLRGDIAWKKQQLASLEHRLAALYEAIVLSREE